MGDAAEDRKHAQQYPEGDVLRILFEQHARIRDLFGEISSSSGDDRKQAFGELRALLVAHETAEEMVLRPVTSDAGGKSVADARNQEESDATDVLKQLDGMDPDSPEFAELIATFEKSVDEHAEAEEHEEFPLVEQSCDEERRQAMGRMMKAVEAIAPTRPHPSTAGKPAAQYAVGPIASLLDHARDAVSKVTG